MRAYQRVVGVVVVLAGCAGPPPAVAAGPAGSAAAPGTVPVVLGESLHLDSRVLAERRTINVYLPPDYASGSERYPVLYMPDGGVAEDFPHIMGVIDVSIRNQVIRPLIVVGIENTERRRDLLGPTTIAVERTSAPHAGGSDRFRRFLREELKPYVATHYRVTAESSLIGESAAGLFVVETLLVEPTLFDSYIAVDPSLWWNGQQLVHDAAGRLAAWSAGARTLYLATADYRETQEAAEVLLAAIRSIKPDGLVWHYLPLPDEHHSTIYPVASIRAFRTLFERPAR